MNYTLECKRCGRKPDEISEYIKYANDSGITPDEYIIKKEGTYNNITGRFYCTSCYIEAGMPLGKA